MTRSSHYAPNDMRTVANAIRESSNPLAAANMDMVLENGSSVYDQELTDLQGHTLTFIPFSSVADKRRALMKIHSELPEFFIVGINLLGVLIPMLCSPGTSAQKIVQLSTLIPSLAHLRNIKLRFEVNDVTIHPSSILMRSLELVVTSWTRVRVRLRNTEEYFLLDPIRTMTAGEVLVAACMHLGKHGASCTEELLCCSLLEWDSSKVELDHLIELQDDVDWTISLPRTGDELVTNLRNNLEFCVKHRLNNDEFRIAMIMLKEISKIVTVVPPNFNIPIERRYMDIIVSAARYVLE